MTKRAILQLYDNNEIGSLKCTMDDLDLSSYGADNITANDRQELIIKIDDFIKDFYSGIISSIKFVYANDIDQDDEEFLDDCLRYDFSEENLVKAKFTIGNNEICEAFIFEIVDV